MQDPILLLYESVITIRFAKGNRLHKISNLEVKNVIAKLNDRARKKYSAPAKLMANT